MAQSSPWGVCFSLINAVTHVLIGAIACVGFLFANIFVAGSFNQHIYLCVTGYVILMSQGIMTISNYGWTGSLESEKKRIIHLSMQIIGSVLAIAGSIIRIANIDNHLTTAHGFLGVFAFIFTCLSLIGGCIAHFTNFKPKLIKIAHSCFGIITVTLAFVAYMLGIDKSLFRVFVNDVGANMLMSFTIIALVGVLIPACMNFAKRISNY